MNEELLLALQDGESWLALFERRTYKKAFLKYCEQFSGFFKELLQTCAEEESLRVAAEWMLTEMEKDWKRQRFWNRSTARLNHKQMLIIYLSPMLLAMEEPMAARFAELLRDGWAARWPKDAYDIAPFERLGKGFRNVILGVDLDAFRRDEEEDD